MARIAAILLLLLGASAFGSVLSAHPFDDRCDMVAEVILMKNSDGQEFMRLQVQYRYETPYASYNEAYLLLDDNRDGKVDREELTKRFETLTKDLQASAVLKVRGEEASLMPLYGKYAFANLDDPDASVDGPNGMPVENLRIGYFFYFDVQFSTSWGPGTHPVEFYMPDRRIGISDPSEQLRAWDDRKRERRAIPSVRYDRTPDRFDRLNFTWVIDEDSSTTATAITPKDPPDPDETQPETAGDPQGKQQLLDTDKERRNEAWFDRWVREAFESLQKNDAGLDVWLVVLGVMFVLGGYHAVQPGHGKTLVASYLIGTQGTKSDALFLGVVVTAAHTSGVLLLMAGAWMASEFWPGVMQNPQKDLAEWIALAVGATIFLMGVGLVMKRAGGGHHEHDIFGRHLDGSGHSHDHGHDHDHGHSHDHSHDHGHDHDHAEHSHEHPPTAVSQQEKTPEDSDVHSHEHTHDGHTHSHDHHHHGAHGHSHAHDHAHGHTHSHNGELDPSKMTRWEILRLGILGGIVPCPSAFVIGLIAFSSGWYLSGLIMVTVFSLGLAAVLSTIGLLMVHSKEYLSRKRKETKSKLYRLLEAKLPVFGALVITLIGTIMVMLAMIRLQLIDVAKFTV